MTKKWKTILVALFSIVILILAACSQPVEEPKEEVAPSEEEVLPTEAEEVEDSAPEESGEPITLTFWFEGEAPATFALFEESFNRFEEANPGVTVEASVIPFEDMLRTMPMALDGGTGPDIATVPPLGNGTWRYAKADHLVELTAIGQNAGWLEKIEPAAIEVNNSGTPGEIYGIPYEWTAVGVYYNKEVFNSLGLTPPTTFAEFEAILAAVKDAGITPVSVAALDGWPLTQVWSQLHHTLVPIDTIAKLEQLDPSVSYENPGMITAAAKIQEWTELEYLDPNMLSTSFVDANNLFLNGEVAMNVGGTWVQADFRQAPFEVGFFAMPQMDPDLPWHAGGHTPYDDIVIVDGPNTEKAIELLNYILSEENMAFWYNSGLLVPYLFATPSEPLDSLQADIFTLLHQTGPGYFMGVVDGEVNDAITAAMQGLVAGDLSPEEAMASIQAIYGVKSESQ